MALHWKPRHLVGALSNSTSLANAIAIFAVAAYAMFFLAAYALPETRSACCMPKPEAAESRVGEPRPDGAGMVDRLKGQA